MTTSKTTNRLHFDDLDPKRFEDLCLAIVYRQNRWVDINHHGRSGSDEGIDIQAVDELENGTLRTWYVQCKRYQKITKADLRRVVEDLHMGTLTPPDILLLITGCDISKTQMDYFQNYALDRGIKRPIIWSASVLEAKLYSEYQDLLFAYFGVSLAQEKRDAIASIRRNIQLKKQMHLDFVRKARNPNETIRRPYKKFEHSEVLIHSIDDETYPNIDTLSPGISGWFKVELYNFYFNGLEVILGIEEVIRNSQGQWDVVEYEDKDRKSRYDTSKCWLVGKIPYDNIIAYDLSGDEYYNTPHLYCDFRNNGMPYEGFIRYTISNESDEGYTYDERLDEDMRKTTDW